jgi:hypothetical protein
MGITADGMIEAFEPDENAGAGSWDITIYCFRGPQNLAIFFYTAHLTY